MLIPLISYPYLIRVLGPNSYGIVLLSQAVVFYFSVFVNLGFEISGTRRVAQLIENKTELSKYYLSVVFSKCMIWTVGLPILIGLIYSFDSMSTHKLLYLICYSSVFFDIFLSYWFYRGLEKVKYITLFSIISKVCSLILIFSFIKSESDFLNLALINLATSIITCVFSLYLIVKNRYINLQFPSLSDMKLSVSDSLPFFYSSIFGVLTSKLNGIIVGFFLGTSELAIYALAEKVANLMSSLLSSVGQVLLPNLAKSKNQESSKKVLRYTAVASLLFSLSIYGLSDIPILILGGEAMLPTSDVLKIFSIYIFCSGVGPLLSNVIVINNYDSFLWKNMMLSTFIYLSIISISYINNEINLSSVSYAFNLSVLVMVFHRLYYIYSKRLSQWIL